MKPKAEKPMAMPNKLIADDIVCCRLCVLILNSGWASSITKALETPSFRKSAELKRNCRTLTLGFERSGAGQLSEVRFDIPAGPAQPQPERSSEHPNQA